MGEYYKDTHRYDDIIELPHHQSRERAHMSLHDRAAQFAPFAALTGHGDAIKETERITEEEIILEENEIERINAVLFEISQTLSDKRKISLTYFQPDERKEGGAYLTDIGTVKKIDEIGKRVHMDSGRIISMERILEISFV